MNIPTTFKENRAKYQSIKCNTTICRHRSEFYKKNADAYHINYIKWELSDNPQEAIKENKKKPLKQKFKLITFYHSLYTSFWFFL